ncbi:MAG: hypothetical protein WDM92_03325 [Caulobacteraceae bacterium]
MITAAWIMTAAIWASPGAPAADAGATSAPPPARRVIVAACTAETPQAGAVFSGTVLQVIDGRTLCVAQGPAPRDWVLVRLADVQDRRARGALMAASFARKIDCTAGRRQGGGVLATCAADGVTLGELTRTDAVKAAGRAWR